MCKYVCALNVEYCFYYPLEAGQEFRLAVTVNDQLSAYTVTVAVDTIYVDWRSLE